MPDVWDDRRIGAGHDWRPEIASYRVQRSGLDCVQGFDVQVRTREQLTKILATAIEGCLQEPPTAEPCVAGGERSQSRHESTDAPTRVCQTDADLNDLAVEVVSGPSLRRGPHLLRKPSGYDRRGALVQPLLRAHTAACTSGHSAAGRSRRGVVRAWNIRRLDWPALRLIIDAAALRQPTILSLAEAQ